MCIIHVCVFIFKRRALISEDVIFFFCPQSYKKVYIIIFYTAVRYNNNIFGAYIVIYDWRRTPIIIWILQHETTRLFV